MTFIGLDGFRKGWVAVTLDGDKASIDFPPEISWLAAQCFSRAAIDMPIGLCNSGIRACDIDARTMLRPHSSRVFSGARRSLFNHVTHADANRDLSSREERKISIQLWGIVKKIKEVDDFVVDHTALDIRETHPELVFLRLNNHEALKSKHTEQGLALRRDILVAHGFADLDEWLSVTRIGTGAKRDDVLDACAAALAARDLAGSIPDGEPPCDSLGLPMQIWF